MMKNSMKKLIYTILILSLLQIPVLAQTQTASTPQAVNQVLSNLEDERTKRLETQLGITIPLETDNPNHIISFKDPSGKGVKLDIDGQGLKAVKSPYTLPSLGIGSHILTFKFTDTEQTAQTLEKTIVIIPRPPVMNAPTTVTKSEITLKGTSLAGSTVELFISGGTQNFKGLTTTSVDGVWSYKFKENFKLGIWTVIARTKKNGFSSGLSEPVVFEISSKDAGTTITKIEQPIYFSFASLSLSNISSTIKNNPHLLIIILLSGLIGGLITWFIESLSTRKVNKTAEGKFIKLLNENEKNSKKRRKDDKDFTSLGKRMTLKEKFENAGFKVPDLQPKEKVLDKKEFMKEFKEEDPDNSKGVEKVEDPKIEKKKVAVSLTSSKRD